jgi:hypothetical protein
MQLPDQRERLLEILGTYHSQGRSNHKGERDRHVLLITALRETPFSCVSEGEPPFIFSDRIGSCDGESFFVLVIYGHSKTSLWHPR